MEDIFIKFLNDLKNGLIYWPRLNDREHHFAIIRNRESTYKLIRTTEESHKRYCIPCFRTFNKIIADNIIAIHNHPMKGLDYAQPSEVDLMTMKTMPFQNKAKIYYAIVTNDFYGCFYNRFVVKQYDCDGFIRELERAPREYTNFTGLNFW